MLCCSFFLDRAGGPGLERPIPGTERFYGAARYDGRPSPVLQARLDHAARFLQRRDMREVVLVSDPFYSARIVGHHRVAWLAGRA